MTIKFIKKVNVPTSYVWTCGDGCCSETRWEDETYLENDTKDLEYVQIEHLTEGIDYIKID